MLPENQEALNPTPTIADPPRIGCRRTLLHTACAHGVRCIRRRASYLVAVECLRESGIAVKPVIHAILRPLHWLSGVIRGIMLVFVAFSLEKVRLLTHEMGSRTHRRITDTHAKYVFENFTN